MVENLECTIAKRADISILGRLLELSSHNVKPAVKVDAFLHAFRSLNEALSDAGHAVDGRFPENLFMDGHFAPAEDFHALLLRDHFKHPLRQGPSERVLRQEKHTDAVVSFFCICHFADPGLACCFYKEFVGDLRQDADAVAHLAGGVLAGPVFELLHDVQRVIQDLVVLSAIDIHNTSDAAGIMFLLVPHSFSSFLTNYPRGRGPSQTTPEVTLSDKLPQRSLSLTNYPRGRGRAPEVVTNYPRGRGPSHLSENSIFS